MQTFNHNRSGHISRQLDSKGRFSLPVSWRPAPGESVFMIRVKVDGIPALRVYTQAALDRKLNDIEMNKEATPIQKDRARAVLYGSALESNVNDQGKLTIPKALAEKHHLELPGAVHVTGRGELFEIFTPENGAKIEALEEDLSEVDPLVSSMLGF